MKRNRAPLLKPVEEDCFPVFGKVAVLGGIHPHFGWGWLKRSK